MALGGPDFIHAWFEEIWNQRNAGAIDTLASPDWVGHGMTLPGDPGTPWRDRFKLVYRTYLAAFPDVSFTVDLAFGDGDHVAASCTARGTHTGDGLEFPATGRPIHMTGLVIARIADGRLVESWESWNFHDMYAQLGCSLTPAPPG